MANDKLYGEAGEDTLAGSGGNDLIEGGAGLGDKAMYFGNFADYTITYNAATRQYTLVHGLVDGDGTDTVRDVEIFQFADGMKTWGEVVPGQGDGVLRVGTVDN